MPPLIFPSIVILDKHIVFGEGGGGEGGLSRKCHRVCTFQRYFGLLKLIGMSLTGLQCIKSKRRKQRSEWAAYWSGC